MGAAIAWRPNGERKSHLRLVGESEEFRWPDIPGVFIAYNEKRCRQALEMIKHQKVVGVDVEAFGSDPKKEHPKGRARMISIQFAGETGPSIFVPLWSVTGTRRERLQKLKESDPDEKEQWVTKFVIDPTGREHLLDIFESWLEDDKAVKVLHNGKYDRHVLANHGITMRGFLGDTLVMDYFYANGQMLHGLKECMRRYFKEKGAEDYRDVFRTPRLLKRPRRNKETGKIERYGKAQYVPDLLEVVSTQAGVDKLVGYAVKDPVFTVKLYLFLRDKLDAMTWVKKAEDLSYLQFYERIARPYGDVLYDMERTGCTIDPVKLKSITARLDSDIEESARKFVHMCVKAGVKPSYMAKVNLNAGGQIAELLYSKLRIRCEKRTNKGAPSTKKNALEAIVAKKGRSKEATRAAELVEQFMLYRSRATLKKMFVVPINRFMPLYGGRLHSNYKQTGTETGRLSSATPNLENIPANKKDEEYELRSCFIAPRVLACVYTPEKGWRWKHIKYVVGDIDLKQIEVRFTAHYTRDNMLITLLNKKWDQHLIASCMLSEEIREICRAKYVDGLVIFREDTPPDEKLAKLCEEKLGKAKYGEIRRRAKVLNFGIIYGMGPTGFANQIGGGATKEDGVIAIQAYFKGFPGLQAGIKDIQRKCRRFGYVKTFLKRYCMIPEIYAEDFATKSAAERQAFNYVIQGSAADMIMLGMLLCFLDKRLTRWGVKMINQIHDEIVFLIPKAKRKQCVEIINEYVSHPYSHTKRVFGFTMQGLVVDTPADCGTGPNWMVAKK